MGSVRQAVLDFDDAVQVPWRPRLRAVPGGDEGEAPRSSGARTTPSRVGACRPPAPAVPRSPGVEGVRSAAATVARPAPTRPRGTRPAPARPAGAAVPGAPAARPVRGGCGPVGRAAASPLRLTRRARRLSVVLTLGLGVALGSWLSPLVAGGGGELQLAGERSVVVQAGDSVWSIATDFAGPDQDVRAVVDAIEELNDLDGARVVPGQVLQLP
ncbi:LysM peptidoglycan-binding domain-containing protein [Geodermatophilus sp. SYSU D00703]